MTDPKLDIWGSPIEGKHECFYCGSYYFVADSTAGTDYIGTYCSKECQEKDTLQLQMAASAEERQAISSASSTQAQKVDNTEIKVGEFRIKVRREESK